jgi:hypothetical protein
MMMSFAEEFLIYLVLLNYVSYYVSLELISTFAEKNCPRGAGDKIQVHPE